MGVAKENLSDVTQAKMLMEETMFKVLFTLHTAISVDFLPHSLTHLRFPLEVRAIRDQLKATITLVNNQNK